MHDLHGRLQALLEGDGWTGLTIAQESSLAALLTGRHALIVAPTGFGKTEAAFLPILHRMLTERDTGRAWPTGFKFLYITPLRALNRDLLARLERWTTELGFTIGVRHGDTPPSERAKQAKQPPDILITTPETVQLLLYGKRLRTHLKTVRFVVVDEVHDLAQSERGAQALIALERIEEVVGGAAATTGEKTHARRGGGFQRIGLSATVAEPHVVARWLAGQDVAPRPIETIVVPGGRDAHYRVIRPRPSDPTLASHLSLPPDVVAEIMTLREVIGSHVRVLVFHNTRDGAEVLVSRSAALDEVPLMELHHGSLSAEHRAEVEMRFRRGDIRALVATSSLELGIDIGAIDHVVQVHSPRSVARLVQRAGRSGHRAGARSEATLLAGGPEDGLECLAVARMAAKVSAGMQALEPLRIRPAPLVVVANQLVALANEYEKVEAPFALELLRRSGACQDLDDGLFEAVWNALLDIGTLRGGTSVLERSGRGRRQFISHISLIPDEQRYRVFDEATKRTVGAVEDAFVAAALEVGATFVMAGRSWQVVEVDVEDRRVRVAPAADLASVPEWTGAGLPVSRELAMEAARLRTHLADAEHLCDEEFLRWVGEPVRRHKAAGLVVPDDQTATIEIGRKSVTVNVPLGTRGNEALGRLTAALWHQRIGRPVGMDSDAYRIRFSLPMLGEAPVLIDIWDSLDPDALDLVMMALLRDSPLLRSHLVHVAKQFGALPPGLDPNRATRAKLDALLTHAALAEEAQSRLLFERLDLEAVADFLRRRQAGTMRVVVQGEGALSDLPGEAQRHLARLPDDETLLTAVRGRIEASSVVVGCTQCKHHKEEVVANLPARFHCRRCGSNQVAIIRPWQVAWLRDPAREAWLARNAQTVATFGRTAALVLAARGVGPEAAVRILQKVIDPEEGRFWRELLLAELQFARTHAYWRS